MKNIGLFIMILYFFKPVLPLASYIIQYDYIVNELCVKSEDHSKVCNGKCHLIKEVGEMSDQDADAYKFPVLESIQFVQPIVTIDLQSKCLPASNAVPDMYNNLYMFISYPAIEHPPLV